MRLLLRQTSFSRSHARVAGQTRQWQAHHRKICKQHNRFVASTDYQALEAGGKTDALLLSQFLVQVYPKDDFTRPAEGSDAVKLFFDLLKGPQPGPSLPPLCRSVMAVVASSPFLLRKECRCQSVIRENDGTRVDCDTTRRFTPRKNVRVHANVLQRGHESELRWVFAHGVLSVDDVNDPVIVFWDSRRVSA